MLHSFINTSYDAYALAIFIITIHSATYKGMQMAKHYDQ